MFSGRISDNYIMELQQTGAVDIFAEVEVEHTWKEVVAGVSSSLHEGNHVVTLKHWSASLYEVGQCRDWMDTAGLVGETTQGRVSFLAGLVFSGLRWTASHV